MVMYRGHNTLCKLSTNSRGTSTPSLDKTADSQTSCSVGIRRICPVHLRGPHHGDSPLPKCHTTASKYTNGTSQPVMKLFPLHFQAEMIIIFLVIKFTRLLPGYKMASRIAGNKNSLSFPDRMSST